MLGIPRSRGNKAGRTLSVIQFSDLEKSKMDSSIDQLDSLISQVKRNWKISTQENPNPLEIALPLLDNTSVGMAYKLPDFLKLTDKISQSLQVAVNEHYQAFNNSVGSYDTICHSINESQQTVKHVKSTLKQISSDISSKNQLLTELNQSSKQYGDMVEILDVIEEIKKVPNNIDNLFADKNFSKIEEVLSSSESLAEKYKLWRIPALNNVRTFLATAKQNLFDTMLEELNSTIYLKSKSSSLLSLVLNKDSTHASHLSEEFSNLELYINNIVNIDVLEKSSLIQTKLNNFLDDVDRRNGIMVNYSQTDFENDPYSYLHALLDTLAKLNKLPKALEMLAQRHPTELHKIVNETAEEIKLKHPNLSNSNNNNKNFKNRKLGANHSSLNSDGTQKSTSKNNDSHHHQSLDRENDLDVDFGLSIGDLNNIVLQDFFWQIFTKFLLVLQSHRVVFEISRKLSDLPEEQFVSNLNSYNFIEIWKNISSEVRSLMYSYIANDDVVFSDSKLHQSAKNGSKNSNTPLALISENWNTNALFDVSKKKSVNLRSATIFQFDEDEFQHGETESLNNLHSQELKNFLKEVFPGFKLNENLSNALINDSSSPYLENEEFTQQETLVPANVFNMRVILESLLVFVQGSKTVFPKKITELTQSSNEPLDFFNDFMSKTFLPQLDETLDYIYENTVNNNSFVIQAISNFKIDNDFYAVANNPESSTSNDIKVFKSGIDFYKLCTKVCQVFNTSLKYREEYSSLVIQLLHKFLNKYEDLYTELLPSVDQQQLINSNNNSKQLNKWLKSPELSHVSLQILDTKKIVDRSMLATETEMLLGSGSKILKSIDKMQILHPKNFDQLTQLLGTVDWILKWLPEMKRLSLGMEDTNYLDTTSVNYLRSNWELIESNQTKFSNLKKVWLTFDQNSPLAGQFDGIVKSFEKLLSNTLLAIRYDIRLRLIYYISATITNNSWNPNSDINALCPEVKELTNLVQLFNSKLFSNLDPKLSRKILYGIPNLIDKLFIVGSELIPVLNGNGVKKIYLNVITIQQSLRTVMHLPEEVDFTHSLSYFDLFKKGTSKIIEQNQQNRSLFNLQENKNMIRLIFSQEFKDQEKEYAPPIALNKKFNDTIRELENAHNS